LWSEVFLPFCRMWQIWYEVYYCTAAQRTEHQHCSTSEQHPFLLRTNTIKVGHVQLQSHTETASFLHSCTTRSSAERRTNALHVSQWKDIGQGLKNMAASRKKTRKKQKNTVHCRLSSDTSVCNYCIILKSFCYFHMEVPHCRPAIYLDIYGAYSNLCTAYYNINTAVGWEVWGLKHPKQIRRSILKFSIRMIVYCLQVHTPFQNHLP